MALAGKEAYDHGLFQGKGFGAHGCSNCVTKAVHQIPSATIVLVAMCFTLMLAASYKELMSNIEYRQACYQLWGPIQRMGTHMHWQHHLLLYPSRSQRHPKLPQLPEAERFRVRASTPEEFNAELARWSLRNHLKIKKRIIKLIAACIVIAHCNVHVAS